MERSFIYSLLLMMLSSCIRAQEISPLFPCNEYLDEPYGTITFFSTPGMDSNTQEGQLFRMDEAAISNIRTDISDSFWEDYKAGIKSNLIDTTQQKNSNKNKIVTGILTIGDKKHRPWDYKKGYLNYVKDYVSRFKSDIMYWEVMNEINWIRDSSLYVDCYKYCTILPEIYKVIKQTNPKSKVLLSGLAGVGEECMEYLCKEEAFRYFDIFNFHSYAIPEELPVAFETARKYMDRFQWLKPVWLTECGMATPHSEKEINNNEYNTLMEEQARRLGRIFLISFSYGIDKVFWYNFRSWEIDPYDPESHFGLLHGDLEPKPAFIAYKTLTRMCPSGSKRPQLIILGDLYICSWTKPDNTKLWALWHINGTEEFKLRINGHPEYYNYLGQRINQPQSVTNEIVYVVGAQSIDFKTE